MPLPLYESLRGTAESLMSGEAISANAGLVHEKYMDCWNADFRRVESATEKQVENAARNDFIKRVAGLAASQQAGDLLNEYHNRRRALAGKDGRLWRRKSLWRLVAGMGRANPLEIGFNWDHRLGVPRLPGSSIKGAVLSWALTGLPEEQHNEVYRIFGRQEKAGTAVLLDAYPARARVLDLDVMNVHYKSYYDSQGAQLPTGMEGPTPLFFLAVPAETEWVTWVLPRQPGADTDVEKALEWLHRCAADWGLGAKTNVGYGYFKPPAPTVPTVLWDECALHQPNRDAPVTVQHASGTVTIPKKTWSERLREMPLTQAQRDALRSGTLRASVRVAEESGELLYRGLDAILGVLDEARVPPDALMAGYETLLTVLYRDYLPVEKAEALPPELSALVVVEDGLACLSEEGRRHYEEYLKRKDTT